MTQYLNIPVFEYARINSNLPKWAKVYKALNEERIQGIVLEGKTFWFENNMVHEPVSDSVYDTIIKYLENNGYNYLYS